MVAQKNEEVTRVKFDEVLLALGGFGVYQKRLLFLVCLTSSLVFMQNMAPVFTMKLPNHRCKIPGYANDTYAIQNDIHLSLVNRWIPVTGEGDFSTCTHFDSINGSGPIPNNGTEQVCSEWVYDQSEFSSTLVTELNLVCGRLLFRSHSNMVMYAGKFFGAFLSSVFSDYFGRRRVYTLMMFVMTSSSLGLVFTYNLPLLMIFKFLIGASTSGSYLCTYVIGMELMGTKHRSMTSTASNMTGVFGALLATLIAYLTRHWQYFQIGVAVPCIPVIIGYFFIPESPRWLVSKGRHEEAQKTIDAIARVNGVSLPKTMQMELLQTINRTVSQTSQVQTVHPLQLFRRPRLFVRYTLVYLSWIFTMMCMYGLMLNVSNMSGNIYLNFTLLCLVDFLSVVCFALVVDRAGRRILLVAVTSLGGLACLATILPVSLGGSSWILRGLSFAGRLCIRSAITTMYIMSPELFPTVLRSFGLGSCSMMSSVGALASPYVADLNALVSGKWAPALPQIVFGVAGLVTAVMTLFQPEIKGRNLPETVDEAERFGRKLEDRTCLQEDEEAMTGHQENPGKSKKYLSESTAC